MAHAPRDMALADPAVRERDYWRTLIRAEIEASAAARGLQSCAKEVLAYRIARAIQADLTDNN